MSGFSYNNSFAEAVELRNVRIGGLAIAVPEYAFCNAPALELVVVADNVETIGSDAFANCPDLKSVLLPESLKFIGDNAFENDGQLVDLLLPAGVTRLGERAFYGCASLEEMSVPDEVKVLPAYLFANSSALRRIVLPDRLEDMGTSTFSGCTSLKDINIPSGIRELPEYVFSGCMALDTLVIPKNVQTIGNHAFGSCGNLAQITFGAQVDTIRDGAFADCVKLQNLYYDGTMADWCHIYFEVQSFQEDTNPLTYARALYMPDEETGEYSLIEDLVIPDEVDSIRGLAFSRFWGAKTLFVSDSVKYIGTDAFASCTALRKARIGAGTIDDYAFSGCLSLDSLTIGPRLRSVGEYAFYYCDRLFDVFYEGDLSGWFLISFAAANANPLNGAERFYVQGDLIEELTVPRYVIRVRDYCFYGYRGLKLVRAHSVVTHIDKYAFANCPNLTGILKISASDLEKNTRAFSAEVPGLSIGEGAFEGCSLLVTMELGDRVTQVGAYAFDGTAWYNNQPDGLLYIGTCAYEYKGSMPAGTVLTLREGTTQVCDGAFAETSAEGLLTGIVLPQSLRGIGSRAFSGCTGLTSINIPSGVTTIGSSAFSGCSNLTGVQLPSSLEVLEENTFENCSSISSLTIPASVKRFWLYAIKGMTGLKSLVLEDSSDTLACLYLYSDFSDLPIEYTYIGRDLNTYVAYGDVVTPMESMPLFQYKETLKEAVIGAEVTEIDPYLFMGCSNLTEISSVSPEPPVCLKSEYSDVYRNFDGVDYNACLLRVPVGAKERYAAAGGWSDFFNIEEDATVGIERVEAGDADVSATHYDVSGRPLSPDAKGLHIIRYSDGRVEKVIVE